MKFSTDTYSSQQQAEMQHGSLHRVVGVVSDGSDFDVTVDNGMGDRMSLRLLRNQLPPGEEHSVLVGLTHLKFNMTQVIGTRLVIDATLYISRTVHEEIT